MIRIEPVARERALTGVLRDAIHVQSAPPLRLAVLYLSERCNSRCVTCDYWRHGRLDMTLESVERRLPELEALGTREVLISGGEPLLNPEWMRIAGMLKDRGMKLWLLTSGLSLAKHAHRVHDLFDSVTVSLDGTNPATYEAIRGLDAFDKVCEGIKSVAQLGLKPGIRVTVQRANYQELPLFVGLARELGAGQVSFLSVDVANPHAFGRTDGFTHDLALGPDDLPVLETLIDQLERQHADDFRSGFIAESPAKLRRLHQYFSALHGLSPFPAVRCNAPEFSAVVEATGRVRPCFFIPGPVGPTVDLTAALNSDGMRLLREDIRAGRRPECATCVCSLWRDPAKGYAA